MHLAASSAALGSLSSVSARHVHAPTFSSSSPTTWALATCRASIRRASWKTPHLDRLAREGMIFTDAHSSSGVCTPTRYTLITGRYSWRSTLKQRCAQWLQSRPDRARSAHAAGFPARAGLRDGDVRQMAPRDSIGRKTARSPKTSILRNPSPADRRRTASIASSASAPRSTCRRMSGSRMIASRVRRPAPSATVLRRSSGAPDRSARISGWKTFSRD